MSGFEIFLIAIIFVAAIIEAFRGFGRAVFDAFALYLALVISQCAYSPLAGVVHLHSGAADNEACVYGLVFALSALLLLLASRFIYGTLLYTAGAFDQLLGVVAGLAIGLMIAHGVTRSISLTDPTGQGQVASYTDTALGDEVLNFTSYHRFIQTLSSFGDDQRQDPTAG